MEDTFLPFQQLQLDLEKHHSDPTLNLAYQTHVFGVFVETNVNIAFLASKGIFQSRVRLFTPSQLTVYIAFE